MARIRHGPSPEDHYSLIANDLARCPNISLQAKGLYVYLRSHREGWEMSGERLGQALGVSRMTVNRYLKELETAGYLVREQQFGDGHKFSSSDYVVLSTPLLKNESTEEKPCNKIPYTEKTDHGDLLHHKKTIPLKKTNSNKKTTTPNRKFGAEFASFWEKYPRKIGKDNAYKKFLIHAEEHGTETVMTAVTNYADHVIEAQTEKRYIPYPSTWLNQDRWKDYLDTEPHDQLNEWLEEIAHESSTDSERPY